MNVSTVEPLIHFETRANKPRVFRITAALISDAAARNGIRVATTLGEDLKDLSWLPNAVGLVTSNDVLRDPLFPLQKLENVAPKLRWIHVTGAGIEPLLPLQWLPKHVALTNNEWPTRAIRFRNIRPTHWRRFVAARLDATGVH